MAFDPALPPNLGDRIININDRLRVKERVTPWRRLNYSGLWTDYDAVNFDVGAARKIDDMVYLRGLAKRSSGTPAVGEVITVLPLGWRPPARLIFGGNEAVGMSRYDIWPSGNLTWTGGNATGAATFTTLSQFYWSTAPTAATLFLPT